MTKIIKTFIYCCSVLLLFSTSSSKAGEIDPELINQLSNSRSSKNIDIIIEFSDTKNTPRKATTLPNPTKITRKELIASLKNKANPSQENVNSILNLRGIAVKNIWLNNTIAASVPESLIPAISSLNNVTLVKLDKKFVLEAESQGGTPSQPDWNITSIGANAVWNTGNTGEGVVVGSMDTGVDLYHPDLATRWRGGNNSWYDPYGVHDTPSDTNGHGTQTTSLIVGGNTSGNTIGIAPGANWIAAKIFDDNDMASISAIHMAFQWMLDPDGNPETDDGADIVNNSWNFGTSFGQCDHEFQNDISILRSADIAVVFSAGNSGPSLASSKSPANNEDTISVGAIDESLSVAFFSSRGPSACDDGDVYPKLTAPGVNVRTADLTFGGVIPNSYTYSSGTSFASAHVSGALALLHSNYPSKSLSDIENALYNTAILTGGENDYGNGVINIDAAAQYMSPIAKPVSPTGNIDTQYTPTYIWKAVTGSTDYYLWVVDISTGSPLSPQWYTAAEAGCANGEPTCSLTPTTLLADGLYRWRILNRNTAGNGLWSPVMLFSIGTLPSATTLIEPAGNIDVNNTPTYTWNAVTGATDYYLWIIDISTGNPLSPQWYSAAEAGCANGEPTCSLTASTPLADGLYRWMILARNNIGNGFWSSAMQFTILI